MSAIERLRSVVTGEQRALREAMSRIERRDPSGATQNLSPYQNLSKTMVSEWDAESAIRLAYYSNIFVYRCVFQCAQSIAGLPIRAGKDPEKPDQFKTPQQSRLAYLLSPPPGGPAPKISARKLIAWTVAQYLVTGKYGWEIECAQPKGKGQVVNLWPLVSCVLNPVPTFGGLDYFSSYVYGKPSANPNDMVNFAKEQVFYAWRPALHDIRQPESALQAARLDISVAVMQDRYDFAFLRNDARPAAVVVHEAFAISEEAETFKRAFRGEFRGPDNAGKTLFLQATGDGDKGVAGAIDIKTLGLSQRDAQFIARYEQKISAICTALGTPLSILGDSTKRTYDAANVEHRNWWEGTLQPLCEEIADEINLQVAPRVGDDLMWFDFSQVKALQSDSRLLALGAVLPLMVGEGKPITISEFRNELGLPELRPDDLTNEAKLDAAAQKAEPGVVPASALNPGETKVALPASTAGGAPGKGASAPTPAPNANGAAPGSGSKSNPGTTRARGAGREMRIGRTRETRVREWRAVQSTVASMEPAFESAVRAVFERQARSVLSKLKGRRGIQTLERRDAVGAAKLFDVEFWRREMAEQMVAQYSSIFGRAHNDVSKILSAADVTGEVLRFFSIKDPRALQFIEERANQLAGNVTQTTYDGITSAMARAASEGASIPDIADSIQDVFTTATDSRATTIARTEVIGAYNSSQNLIGRSLPDSVVNGKEWIATEDDRTRPDHADADGQQVASDDTFQVGDSDMQAPGDESAPADEVINCRCTLRLLTPEDWASGSGNDDTGDIEQLAGSFETGGVEGMRELIATS